MKRHLQVTKCRQPSGTDKVHLQQVNALSTWSVCIGALSIHLTIF